LAHGIELRGRAQVLEERGNEPRITESSECVDEFVEASRGVRMRLGGDDLSCWHADMLTC